MYKPQVYINGERLDLFDDEKITIKSSVQNINDITKVFNDYSRSFTVPATPKNNRIFKHYYNASIDGGFDARIRHDAIVDIQTIPFKKGTIRLEGSLVRDNKPIHYKITFFGLLIDLKEVIGDDYLSSLDLSEYDMDYSSANVQTGLQFGFSSGDYVFPLISTDQQYLYDSNISNITEQERLANIAWNGAVDLHGITWTSLRPALRTMRIIEAIEEKYDITFSRDFLGNEATEQLYLWLANQDTEDTLLNRLRITDFDSVSTFQADKGSFNNSTGAYSVTDKGTTFIREMDIRVESSDNKSYTVQLMNNNNVIVEKSGSGDIDIDYDFPSGVEKGSQLYVRIVASAGKVIDYVNFRIKELSEDTVCFVERTTDLTLPNATATTSNFMPSMKVLDFLKSYFNLFNLTIVPSSKTDFNVYQLDDWYLAGNTYDINPYIDTEIPTDRPKIYKEISFKYQEPKTILASQFLKTNNVAYGDLETKLSNADGKTLDGGEFEIEVDFEQMVYEKLIDQNTGEETNVVYGLSLSDSLGDELPESHLLYIRLEPLTNNTLSFINDTNQKVQLASNAYMPSHTDSSSKSYSTTFGSEIDEHDGGIIENSLFNLYYKDYITDSFSIKRRKYTVEAKLPIKMLSDLKLNDKLIIGSDRYLINDMNVNVTTQKVKFTLLNDIYLVETDTNTQNEETEDESQNEPTPSPETATTFNISSTGSTTSSGGCALVPDGTKYWDGQEANPTLGDTIYNEALKTTVFDGGNMYYKISGDLAIRITALGMVNDVFDCNAMANQ